MVSVIVPVRNRPEAIAACLDAISSQRYPADRIESIVVDDASTDSTPHVVSGRASTDRVRLIRLEVNRGPSACRNIGAGSSSGEILAFVDSDCLPDPAWIDLLVEELSVPGTVAAGGAVVQWPEERWLQRYEVACSPLSKGSRAARVTPGGDVDFLPSCNLAIRKDTFGMLGGFDPSLRFGEDVDLVWRLCREGEVRYRPEAAVRHRGRDRLWPFLRDRVSYTDAQADFLFRFPENARRIDLSWRSGAAGFAAGIYRLGRVLTRYDGVLVVALGGAIAPWWSGGLQVASAVVAAMVGSALIEWVRLRPRLGVLGFVAAHVLDDLASGVGTVRGCVRRRTVRPLIPNVTLRPRRLPAAEASEARASEADRAPSAPGT